MTNSVNNAKVIPAKEEMPLEKKIKNLQVSISIAKREIKEILTMMTSLKNDEKKRKTERLAQLEKIIATKEMQLEPLKAQRGKNGGHRSKIEVTQEEISAVMKKYGVTF